MQFGKSPTRIKPFFLAATKLKRSARRLALSAVLCVALAGCGFSPIYAVRDSAPEEGGGKQVRHALSQVAIANIPDRLGQKLRNHLMDRMYAHGRPASPAARLQVNLTKNEVDLGVQKDATTTRRQLNMWANYTLFDQAGAPLCSGKAHSVVSYSKLAAQYGTVAAQENAQDRAVREIGEQITNRLSLYYAESPAAAASKNLSTKDLATAPHQEGPDPLTESSLQDKTGFLSETLPQTTDRETPVSESPQAMEESFAFTREDADSNAAPYPAPHLGTKTETAP